MSNESEQNIAGALTYPEQESLEPISQPRQPQNLQGLLRFAMEATKAEDAPNESVTTEISEERKQFLENALKSMTIDVIEVLIKNIRTLSKANSLSVDSDITEYLNSFETILSYVDDIDTAIDFHKIGGFSIIPPCLNSVHAPIRANACNLIAELCQNNPYCQIIILDNDILPILTSLLDDMNYDVAIKALYAISCTVRENQKGYEQLRNLDGLRIILRVLQKPNDKIRTKASFLLLSLISSHPEIKNELCDLDGIPVLISLISDEKRESHEFLLSLLQLLINDNTAAVQQCRNPKFNLKLVLQSHLNTIKNLNECKVEAQICKEILEGIFKMDSNEADR